MKRDLGPRSGALARWHLAFGDGLIGVRARLRAPTVLGVRLVAFDTEGRVLLVQHSYLPGWHLPGGAVDPGESARAAAVREVEEETGLSLGAAPRLLGLYFHRTAGRRDHVAVYVAEGARAGRRPGASSLEIREIGWFDPHDLPQATTRATRARIAEALGEAEPGDAW